MKRKQGLSLLLALIMTMLLFVLAACGGETVQNRENTNVLPPSESTSSQTAADDPASSAADDSSQSENSDGSVFYNDASNEERALACPLIYVEEQGDNVYVIFKKPDVSCETFEVLRGTEDSLTVIASLPDNSDTYCQLYTDQGAAGNDYFYAVRGVSKITGALMTVQVRSVDETQGRWYANETEHLRLNLPHMTDGYEGGGNYGDVMMRFDSDGNEIEEYKFGFWMVHDYTDSPVNRYSDTLGDSREWEWEIDDAQQNSGTAYFNFDENKLELGIRHQDDSRPMGESFYTTDTVYNVL